MLKFILMMISFIFLLGCSDNDVFNQTKDVCKINFSEDKKDLENIPCLKPPISSQDFSSLSKLKNGWYDLDNLNFVIDNKEYLAPESHSFARIIGYFPVNQDYVYILMLQNMDMEGDGFAQTMTLLKAKIEDGVYKSIDRGYYVGTHRFNFSELIDYDSEMEMIDFRKISDIPYHGECKQDFVIHEDFSLNTRKVCTNKIDLDKNYIEEKQYKLDSETMNFVEVGSDK
ncbi:hypothetical protein [Acinetobacter sp. NIPH 2699]|uniref:hypothetical protein n=1 Tax=Acinetobacter sp. NIPH 2699 TaxID=2923433 RepID=UPI001F4AE2F1|nr:hypothetical protein [Acinetobacter sp. NIPH 2699]MCH7335674.1 hypothetical protein [Acinetobacter sp. NIPH 2699]